MSDTEYRVRWQRQGRGSTTRIYQSEAAARRKIDGILALEEIKDQTKQWNDLPDLVNPPELQVREVGDWGAAEPAAQDTASEGARTAVALWAGVGVPDDDDWPAF